MVGLADREAARGVSETYQYLIGDSAFHFTVNDGSIELHDGRAQDPAVTLTTDEETWADIASGKMTATSAAATGALTLAGVPEAAKRLRRIFAREPMLAQARTTIDRA
jgi:putative sterol carrier protein